MLPPNKMVAMVANFVVGDRVLLGPAKEKVNRGCIKKSVVFADCGPKQRQLTS